MARYSARRQRRWRHTPEIPEAERVAQRWRNHVFKHLRFLGHLRANREPGTERWKAGMIAHYRTVIEQALENPPSGCEKEARDFRSKLRKL